jgi:phytoene dehydrogenase-like protein
MPSRGKVVILGGGIAGMSAAHELLERGFEVDVFERKSIAGGKARSLAADPASGLVTVNSGAKLVGQRSSSGDAARLCRASTDFVSFRVSIGTSWIRWAAFPTVAATSRKTWSTRTSS